MTVPVQFSKLPLWRTVGQSYALGLKHMVEIVTKGWKVLATLALLALLGFWISHPYEMAANAIGTGWATLIAIPSATIAFTAMIAVPWHRFVLDNEPVQTLTVNMQHRVLNYFAWGIVLSAPLYATVLVTEAMTVNELIESSNARLLAFVFFAAIGLTLYLIILTRFSIKLAAIAVDDERSTNLAIWQSTRRQFWSLFLATAFSLGPSLSIALLVAYIAPDESLSRETYAIVNTIVILAEALLGIIWLSFLSLAYRHFMRR